LRRLLGRCRRSSFLMSCRTIRTDRDERNIHRRQNRSCSSGCHRALVQILTNSADSSPRLASKPSARTYPYWAAPRLTGIEPKPTIGKTVQISALNLEISESPIEQSGDSDRLSKKAASACESVLDAQGSDGGWGPHAGTPSEVFDTAVVLFHLDDCVVAEHSGRSTESARERALQFLYRTQAPAGGWPETTRPPGGQSYAQHISTTAWALMALLTEAIRSI
jgi:hypothetical protein